MLNIILICWATYIVSNVLSYNLNTKFPTVFKGAKDSYFGYSVALHRNKNGAIALIGAPRSNSSVLGKAIYQPGALYKCDLKTICEEVILDKEGDNRSVDWRNMINYGRKDTRWLGVSLDSSIQNEIITCGHLWMNQLYYANGMCYSINGNLDPSSVMKIMPFADIARQTTSNRVSYYAFGQVGTSIALSEDGNFLYLGAPGFYNWAGTFVRYDLRSRYKYRNYYISDSPEDHSPVSYVGYSMTSGKFYDSIENNVVTGAPRDGNFFGRVYIYKSLNGRMLVHQKINGLQFGEYFGATVLAVNLDNDFYTDLLVAAPLHSLDYDNDAGKVYVFLSNGVFLQMYAELYGMKKVSARFGTSIANLGDINQDGFNDIAIGAPYDDEGGSIYIYHGAANGIKTEFVQRITAKSIDSTLRGFGIHISKGFDIDSNQYPDVLVGAYTSSKAVLFRAQPIIQVQSKITFKPKQINTNLTNCVYQGEKVSCFSLTACLRFGGKHAPDVLKFDNEISLEHPIQGNSNRGFFFKNGKTLSVLEKKTKLKENTDTCITEVVYIRPNVQDIITPFQVYYSYNLISNETNNNFKKIPVIDPSSSKNHSSSISFLNGCGEDDKCFSDLAISVKLLDHIENTPLVIGQNSTLSLLIEVLNFGEPAYLSELSIFLPDEAPSKKDICSTDIDSPQSQTALLCYLGNPFLKGKPKSYVVKLDLTKIPVDTKQIHVTAEARTASNETKPHDNSFIFPINFISIADIAITGTPSQEQISFDEKSKTNDPLLITHTYFVMNRGPSPLTVVNFTLSIPSFQKGRSEETFASLVKIETDRGNPLIIPVKCFDVNLVLKSVAKESKAEVEVNTQSLANNSFYDIINEFKPKTSRARRSTRKKSPLKQKNDLRLDCDTVKCITIHCSASPFISKRKFARIAITIEMNVKVINEFSDPWNKIEFVTSSINTMQNSGKNQLTVKSHSGSTQVKTIIVRSGPPVREEVSRWVIFVSIGVGLLLLIIILILLIKFGFFRRKQKEKMEEMKRNTSVDFDYSKDDLDTEIT